ncbi:MAG: DUF58 domain-containing protein [Planctomycetota bacterium]|nr:MAG: DUF58 domain-containing protein [Planctomycetota bacterium]
MIIGQRSTTPKTLDELLSAELMHRLDRLDVISRRIFAGKLPGERRSKKRGQSVEFDDFRPYTTGDDLRHIDWNIYARLDRLIVKLFREDEDLSVVLVLDCSSSMDVGSPTKLIFAHQLAMALGYVALVNQNRLSAARFDHTGRVEQIRPIRGRHAMPRLTEFILQSLHTPSPGVGEAGFDSCVRRIAAGQGGRGVMIVISDFLFRDGWSKGLKYLAHAGGRGFDLTCIQVLSRGELEPAREVERGLVGDVRLTDIESGRAAEVTLTRTVMKGYERKLADLLTRLERDCKARAMRYALAPSDTDLNRLMLDTLRRRGVLG